MEPVSTKAIPLAYLITFSCYGKRLHGDATETVDRRKNIPGTPFFPPNPLVAEIEEQQMVQPAYEMEAEQQAIVLRSIQEVCAHREWRLWAVHVRSNHAHVVVSGQPPPEKIMNDFKAYASRALNRSSRSAAARKRWARHGSTRYLWETGELAAAIDYVVREQGDPLAVWENPDRTL